MLDLIERKAAGEEIAVQPEAEEPAAAPDLMAALEASLAAVRSGDEAPKPRKPTEARTATARANPGARPKRRRNPEGHGPGSGKAAGQRARAKLGRW